jgi:hypothetical protein
MAPETRTTRQQARQQGAAVLKHIYEEIMGIEATSPPKLALDRAGVCVVTDLLQIPIQEVDYYTYIPDATPNGPPVDLDNGNKGLIRLFLQWYQILYEENDHEPLTAEQWMKVDGALFEEFRLTPAAIRPCSTGVNNVSNTTNGKQTNAVADFKKGIKRDAAVYPMLKDQKHWDAWNRSLITQASAHDVSEVLDPSYVPPRNDPEAEELFKQKKIFVYSVLNKCVMTDQGKSFVREHDKDFDAQAVYRKLLDHASKSTAADFTKDKLVEYLTTAKLNSSWKGTTEGFLLHWNEQFRLLNDLLPTEEHYSEAVKRRMLESAVKQIPELKRIKDLDNNRVAAGGTRLDYHAYCASLMSAAIERDENLKLPNSYNRRVVNFTDTDMYSGREEDWYDQGYLDGGIDVDPHDNDQFLLINQMQQRSRNHNRIFFPEKFGKNYWKNRGILSVASTQASLQLLKRSTFMIWLLSTLTTPLLT